MAHLAQTPTNMSSIGEVCDRLGKTFLMSLLGNLSATGGLRVNSSSVKGGVISFSLFLLEGMQYCRGHTRQPVWVLYGVGDF